MDRRTLLAITLILMVLMLPSLLTRPAPPPARGPAVTDGSGAPDRPASEAAPAVPIPRAETAPVPTDPGEPTADQRVTVSSPLYRYTFSSRGGRLVGAELQRYRSFSNGDSARAQLIPVDSDFLDHALVFGNDTLWLNEWQFEPSHRTLAVGPAGATLTWVGRRGPATIRLRYTFEPDHYRIRVRGSFEGIPVAGGLALIGLGPRLRSVERDSASDFRSYGVVTKARSTENLKFTSLDPGETVVRDGPFEWVAVKSKYFLAAIMSIDENQPRFGGIRVVGGQRDSRGGMRRLAATRAHVRASMAAPGGEFGYDAYVGPQEYRRLNAMGRDLEDVNPYGWILRPIIAPLSVLVVRLLLWLHETLNLAYGWVLILFGIAVRVALWPLNQKAMRSSIEMQALQPEMQAIQQRYRTDRAKMQEEMMKLYRRHGMGPLGPLAGGCFPMLLQMPILFTLFFVFLNTIEFRGVPFLWLPDLSLADPYYVVPLLMGGAMFVLSKVGQIGVPPNPQQKIMTYAMPIIFTALFFRFSSGLNLYYATSTIASLPQQWLIARERLRRRAAKH